MSVKIWEEDDSVYIRVEDDGVGFLQGAVSPGAHNHIAPVSYTHLDVYKRQVYTRIRPVLVSARPMLLTTMYTGFKSAVMGMTRDSESSIYSCLLYTSSPSR